LGQNPFELRSQPELDLPPRNTLESLRLAVGQGADMVEVDLQLTRDGQLVAFHDWELERMTGVVGYVEELTRAELRSIPVVRHPGKGPRPASIASLQEVLDDLPLEIPLNLELKRRRAGASAVVRALTDQLALRGQVLVSSFDWPLLAEVRRRLPGLPVAPLGKRQAQALLTAAEELGAFSVHCHRSLARRALIRAAEAAGRPILAYTVNLPGEARQLLGRSVAGLFTDFPGRLRRELEEAP
jgi:glycerophosphoryl diester phosphodiesterase